MHAGALRRLFEKLLARSPPKHSSPDGGRKIDAANTAILVAEKSAALGNACPAMKSDIVKPMPARAPAPANCRHVYSAGLTAMPARTAAAAARNTPTGFPMARPATIAAMSQPCPTNTPGLIVTPAFARRRSGGQRSSTVRQRAVAAGQRAIQVYHRSRQVRAMPAWRGRA